MARRLLLAGSVGPERIPPRPDQDRSDWYLPAHLRHGQASRDRIAAQVLSGADVVVAPTWLTHRRALLPVGETRRAADWTAAAVRVAREAVEVGLERRDREITESAATDPTRDRPVPMVAASLPALTEEAAVTTGRLLPRDTATERDYRDQAGVTADAEPDLLLVEGQRTAHDARIAISAAGDTGLPVWAALTPEALGAIELEAWLEWCRETGVARLLVPAPLDRRLPGSAGSLAWGGLERDPDEVGRWLTNGASSIGWLDGATAKVVRELRTAIDGYERNELEREHAERTRWQAMVSQAARMAPGGRAAWIGSAPQQGLPAGFDWLVVDHTEVHRLPEGHVRLAVAVEASTDVPSTVLERGGMLVGPLPHPSGLRPLVLDGPDSSIAISRRED